MKKYINECNNHFVSPNSIQNNDPQIIEGKIVLDKSFVLYFTVKVVRHGLFSFIFTLSQKCFSLRK